MEDYKRLYHIMFDAATRAEESIDEGDYGRAKRILMEAQERAEEEYIEWEAR